MDFLFSFGLLSRNTLLLKYRSLPDDHDHHDHRVPVPAHDRGGIVVRVDEVATLL